MRARTENLAFVHDPLDAGMPTTWIAPKRGTTEWQTLYNVTFSRAFVPATLKQSDDCSQIIPPIRTNTALGGPGCTLRPREGVLKWLECYLISALIQT